MTSNKSLRVGDILTMNCGIMSDYIVIAKGPRSDRIDVWAVDTHDPKNKRSIGIPMSWVKCRKLAERLT